jgi:pSer/pThr/pTyr-binding forkhead associated (FHA) protein
MSDDLWEAVKDPALGLAPFAFKILRKDQHVKTVRLEPEVTYIGRMPENHVVLDDGKVSRSHARVIKKGNQYFIQDQESENGIFVNGKKVEECALKPGLLVGIGSHVLEVVEAKNQDRPAARESQLEQAEEEEWRMDQTISGTPEQIAKMVQARQGAKEKDSPVSPKMSIAVSAGAKVMKKEFGFAQARARKESDGAEDSVEIKITSGAWVFYKKIPM